MEMITTRYIVLHTDGSMTAGEVDWPKSPSLKEIKALVEPILDGEMEHVRVLDPTSDEYRDMFVDELSRVRSKPRNEAATALYRNNWLVHEGGEPEDLPWIAGNAVLFDRVIWS
jgi:hypothetical protein